MAVWTVDDERLPKVGPRLAAAPEVTHCYARNAIDGFPYTAYSMIHGPDRESVLEVAARLSEELDLPEYVVLFSTREFKKVRLRYFLPELDRWWSERVPAAAGKGRKAAARRMIVMARARGIVTPPSAASADRTGGPSRSGIARPRRWPRGRWRRPAGRFD